MNRAELRPWQKLHMIDPKLAFLYTKEVEQLKYPEDCPFKTERAGLTRAKLKSFGLLGVPGRIEVEPHRATRAELERFHPPEYLNEFQRAFSGDLRVDALGMGIGGADTPVFKDAYEYGAWACGASIDAADLLLSGQADIAFNPLGGLHHAKASQASGFCYLNDVVLGCMRLAEVGKRVLFLDIDAHHSDGVQSAFYNRSDVLTISFHESGKTLFPWTSGFEHEIGEGPGRGYAVNVPFPVCAYDEIYVRAFERIVPPLIKAYDPHFIALELGMDSLAGDPLTHLSLTNNAYAEIIQRLMTFNRPMFVTGGGGYNVQNTVRGWAFAWKTFCADDLGHDLSMGLGGDMLGSTEWVGGLRDRELPVGREQRRLIEPEVEKTIRAVTENVFPIHGISVEL